MMLLKATKVKKIFMFLLLGLASPPLPTKPSETSLHARFAHRGLPTKNASHTEDHAFKHGRMHLLFARSVYVFVPLACP